MAFYWLDDDSYAKLKGQTQMRIQAILSTVYAMHGYKDYAAPITSEIMGIVEESWDIVRGKPKPLPEPNLRKWEI